MAGNIVKNTMQKCVKGLENESIPFHNYILIYFCAAILRYLFEAFNSIDAFFSIHPAAASTTSLHFTLSFLTAVMVFAVYISLIAKIPIVKVYRVSLAFSLAIILAPIIDAFVPHEGTLRYMYYMPDTDISYFWSYLTFFGDYHGISPGMRIEMALIFVCTFFYFNIKGVKPLASIFYVLILYSILFVLACAPILLYHYYQTFGFYYEYSSLLMNNYYGFFILTLLVPSYYLADKKTFKILLKDIRLQRVLYYELNILFGVSIALTSKYNPYDYLAGSQAVLIANISFAMISTFFAALFCIMTNNIYDVAIDKISNPDRPLITKELSLEKYSLIRYVFMALAMAYALLANFFVFAVTSGVMAAYFLYSATPIRFKRVPVLSKTVIGFCSFVMVLMGFNQTLQGISDFPQVLMIIYFVGISLAANVIDLKDIQGDKKAGIYTLPILIGERPAKILIGLALIGVTLSYHYILQNTKLLPIMLAVGLTFFYLVNKRKFEDWKVLALSNLTLVGMIIYLCAFVE